MTEAPRFVATAKRRMSSDPDQISSTTKTKKWNNLDDLVVLVERNFYGHPLAGLLWERNIEEVLCEKR